ncbi:hypothetical protein B296_00053975, partial [Ensete ventricosum]
RTQIESLARTGLLHWTIIHQPSSIRRSCPMEEAAAGEESMGLRTKMASHSAPALLFTSLLLLPLFARAHGNSSNRTTGPMVPAVFAFGDSIVDPGNNDVLLTTIRCDFPPYGQDFIDHQATGRFSNGLIPTDLIGKFMYVYTYISFLPLLGIAWSFRYRTYLSIYAWRKTFSIEVLHLLNLNQISMDQQLAASGLGVKELLPPYLGVDLSPEDILTGVSFASGATGFDPITPEIVSVFSMNDELKFFEEYKEKLYAIAGEERGAEIVSEAFYMVCAGTDDIANTYFTTPFRRAHYDIPSYVNLLIAGASDFIKVRELHARRLATKPHNSTTPRSNRRSKGFPENSATAGSSTSTYTTSCLISFGDPATTVTHPSFAFPRVAIWITICCVCAGFKVSTKGCCGTGTIEVTLLCNSKTTTVCSDVTDYVFWDSYHPTEKAYKVIVNNIFDNYIQFLV